MTEWECRFCTALNSANQSVCWKCKRDRSESDLATATARAAARGELAELEGIDAQRRLDQRAAAERAEKLRSESQLEFSDLLRQYLGQTVGMNAKEPTSVVDALLVSVQKDHFEVEHDSLMIRIPYSQILRFTSSKSGGLIKVGIFGGKYSVVIEIFHVVVYKGAIGFGFSIPS